MEILCGDDSVGGFATVYCGLLPDREEKREHTDKRKYRKRDIDRNCHRCSLDRSGFVNSAYFEAVGNHRQK